MGPVWENLPRKQQQAKVWRQIELTEGEENNPMQSEENVQEVCDQTEKEEENTLN